MSHFYILIVGETSISWWSIYLTPSLTYRNIIINDNINKISFLGDNFKWSMENW